MNVRLAVLLGSVALVRPVLSITGAFDGFKPAGPIIATVAICVLQIAVVLWRRVPNPVLTLIAAGVVYGILAILLNLSLHPFLDSAEWIPLPGYFAIVIFNAAQGAALGLVAWLIRRVG